MSKHADSMSGIYARKAGGEPAEWRKAMRAETWYNAQEAVDSGLADKLDAEAEELEATLTAKAKFAAVFATYNYAGRDKAPAPQTPPAEPAREPEEKEDADMALNATLVALATGLGVKDPDKLESDEKVSAAITAKLAEKPAEPPKNDDKKDDKKDDKPADAVDLSDLPAGAVVVDRGTLDALQNAAAKAVAVEKRLDEQERDTSLLQAVRDGKLTKDAVPGWQASWDRDPKGTKATLERIPKNLVPTNLLGLGEGSDTVDQDYEAIYGHDESQKG